jgi:hypothetical protein
MFGITGGPRNSWTFYLRIRQFAATKIYQYSVQVALVIRGLDIHGFDYSRTQKPQTAMENYHF